MCRSPRSWQSRGIRGPAAEDPRPCSRWYCHRRRSVWSPSRPAGPSSAASTGPLRRSRRSGVPWRLAGRVPPDLAQRRRHAAAGATRDRKRGTDTCGLRPGRATIVAQGPSLTDRDTTAPWTRDRSHGQRTSSERGAVVPGRTAIVGVRDCSAGVPQPRTRCRSRKQHQTGRDRNLRRVDLCQEPRSAHHRPTPWRPTFRRPHSALRRAVDRDEGRRRRRNWDDVK